MDHKIFINRRKKGNDRRLEADLCEGLDVDIYHRKRRKNPDRRAEDRTLEEDYQAFMQDDTVDEAKSSDTRYH